MIPQFKVFIIMRKQINIKCDHCNCEYDKDLSEYKRNVKKGIKNYCNRKCYFNSKKNNNIKNCKNCNTEIINGDSRKIFCSKSCSAIYNNKNRKGEKRHISEEGKKNIRNARNNRLGITEIINSYYSNPKTCKHCNSVLEFKFRKRVFCNIKCKNTYNQKNMSEYQIYHSKCKFDFNLKTYKDEFDFSIVKKYGWYSPTNKNNNLNGISRDHIISISFGFENNIDPKLISHPANCKLMQQKMNSSKHKKCDLNINDLVIKINNWNNKYIKL